MTKLRELSENYQNLWNLVDDESMDLTIIETALQSVETAITEKAENLAEFIKSLDSDIEVFKTEESRLAERRKTLENKRDWLKKHLQEQMEFAGLDKVKGKYITISIQNNPASVNVIEEKGIPTQYWIPQPAKLDRKAILAALKAGEEVIGTELRQTKSLRLR